MATRGVFQLRKLKIRYCDWGGSSRGARDFIRERIAYFARETPAAEIETEVKRGRHPCLVGEYISGDEQIIGVKNLSPQEIWKYAISLRNSSGGKVCVNLAAV